MEKPHPWYSGISAAHLDDSNPSDILIAGSAVAPGQEADAITTRNKPLREKTDLAFDPAEMPGSFPGDRSISVMGNDANPFQVSFVAHSR